MCHWQAGGEMSNPVTKDDWIFFLSVWCCMMVADTPLTVPFLSPWGSEVHIGKHPCKAQVHKGFVLSHKGHPINRNSYFF